MKKGTITHIIIQIMTINVRMCPQGSDLIAVVRDPLSGLYRVMDLWADAFAPPHMDEQQVRWCCWGLCARGTWGVHWGHAGEETP